MYTKELDKILNLEGKYSNNPSDSGGKTMYGITEATARAEGYDGDMKDLPIDIAKSIYYERYWKPLLLDDITVLSGSIASELFDTAVNQGVGKASKYLQRCLNSLNRQGLDYVDIKLDGYVGKQTLAALRSYLNRRGVEGELVMLRCLNCLQGAFYINLAEIREKDEDFLYGWVLKRVVI